MQRPASDSLGSNRSTDDTVSGIRWVWIASCLIALTVAGYLTFLKLTGRISDLAGCGGDTGCGSLLGGRWANWFRVPISAWALVVYLPLLIVGWPGLQTPRRRLLALAGASVLVAAAAWFLFVQLAIEHHFCLYCALLHACGLAILLTALAAGRKLDLQQRAVALILCGTLASLTLVALVLGQLYGPQPATHQITVERVPGSPVAGDRDLAAATTDLAHSSDAPRGEPQPAAATGATPAAAAESSPPATVAGAAPPERQVSYLDGHIRLSINEVPLLGRPDARHIMLKYFDYTCGTCRRMHDQLEVALASYPDDLAVIVLPCPLNRNCNPYADDSRQRGPGSHEYACELARLALGVWRADRGAFRKFHDELFALQGRVTPNAAELIAKSRVQPERLAQAMNDPWIDATLNDVVAAYGLLRPQNPRMPKLLLGGKVVMHGAAVDTPAFLAALRRHYQLGAPSDSQASSPSAD